MIKFVKKVCAVAALTAVSGLSWAGDADEALKSLLDRYQGFSADFSQIASADQGQRVQENTGHLSVQKPNQFRWISNEPYPQEIVGDGQHIWIYDPDLEQVTRKAAQNGSTSAPALILNGQIDELQEQFAITSSGESDGGDQLFELTPLDEQNSFKRIRLFFAGEIISELALEDTLGQRTTIVFENQLLNPSFSSDMFTFDLPEGADLILENEL